MVERVEVPVVTTAIERVDVPYVVEKPILRVERVEVDRIVELATREDLWEAHRAAGLRLVERWRERTRDAWPRLLRRARLEQPPRAGARAA